LTSNLIYVEFNMKHNIVQYSMQESPSLGSFKYDKRYMFCTAASRNAWS